MEITPSKLQDTFIITLSPHEDARGFFMRTYDKQVFADAGIDRDWVQESHSRSEKKGIIRGLHFLLPPYSENKLVRCTRGRIYDVYVDLRKNSSTFGQWDGVELSEENKKMVFLPKGFAHGFCTLTDVSEIVYKMDAYYHPEYERTIVWNDETLGIDWPTTEPITSEKDKKGERFKDMQFLFEGDGSSTMV